MDKKILEEILATKERCTEEEEQRFLELVEKTSGNCDIEVARVLMKTFSSKPDYGTQEDVICSLSTGGHEIFIQAMLEELPRLRLEAPDWVECLLGPEIDNRFDLLKKIVQKMPQNIKNVLKEIISDKNFCDDFPNAKKLID
jgi:hypothetical protein